MKLNFDASFESSARVGAGMVAQDHDGLALASVANFPMMAPYPVLAEALALRWSIGSAHDLGFRRVCFETDCLQLFQRWKKPQDGASYLSSIVRECIFLCRTFDFASLSFVRSSDNLVADLLAQSTSSFAGLVWIEKVHPLVVPFVTTDVLASVSVQI